MSMEQQERQESTNEQEPQPEQQGTQATEPSQKTEALFADSELESFRSRWDDVQGEFVDRPKETVQKADDLVADLVDRLTNGFSKTRAGLEEQWNKGEEASTEDLRVALTRYRSFFHRLLEA